MTTFSVILPTMGRRTLPTVLENVKSELGLEDECLVCSDGPNPWIEKLVVALEDERFKYLFTDKVTKRWGNPQRDMAAKQATKTFIVGIDDDDLFDEGAIEKMRSACDMAPDRPHIFAIAQLFGTIYGWDWDRWRPPLGMGNFVYPNNPEKIAIWDVLDSSNGGESDQIFTKSTCMLYNVPPMAHNIITYLERAAGEY